MAVWPFMLGFGIGLVGAIITVIAMTATPKLEAPRRERPKHLDEPGKNCVICHESMSNDDMQYLNCGHALHGTCAQNYRQHGFDCCPTCRRAM